MTHQSLYKETQPWTHPNVLLQRSKKSRKKNHPQLSLSDMSKKKKTEREREHDFYSRIIRYLSCLQQHRRVLEGTRAGSHKLHSGTSQQRKGRRVPAYCSLPPTRLCWCLCCFKANGTRKQILLENNHHPNKNNWLKDAAARFLLLLCCISSCTVSYRPFHQILHLAPSMS